jgi:HK97 family phage prohead protease
MLILSEANPGDVRHKIVPFNITGAAVKASGKSDGFESDTSDPAGRYAGFIKGFAGRLMNIDSGLDIIFPGACGDLTQFAGENGDGTVAWQHDWSDPIGLPLIAREEYAPQWGLYTEARISRTNTGEKCMTLVNDKVVKKLSIGYRLKRDGYSIVNREGLVALMRGYHIPIPQDKQEEVLADFDARKLDEVWALTSIQLFEYSPVTFPMNGQADITGSKDLGGTLDGLPFHYHPLLVATAIKGLVARIRKFKEIRAQENRKPTQAHVDGLKELTVELKEALTQAETLLTDINAGGGAETGTTGTGDVAKGAESAPALVSPEDAVRLYGKFLELEARITSGAPLI